MARGNCSTTAQSSFTCLKLCLGDFVWVYCGQDVNARYDASVCVSHYTNRAQTYLHVDLNHPSICAFRACDMHRVNVWLFEMNLVGLALGAAIQVNGGACTCEAFIFSYCR